MLPLIVIGSRGRMGQALIACAARDPNLRVVAQINQGDDLHSVIEQGRVVIDFSSHTGTAGFATTCARHGRPMVIGTTGHSDQESAQIREAATRIPIVLSSNFSTGVNALFWLTRKAAEILGPSYDVEIIEMHHRLKRDAPSGTAKTLVEILAQARSEDAQKLARHGRSGITGERTTAEIGVHAVRGGDVIGDHTVIFAGTGERVEITHKASSRDTFALGALRAAEWVLTQKPGLYDMGDVLGLG